MASMCLNLAPYICSFSKPLLCCVDANVSERRILRKCGCQKNRSYYCERAINADTYCLSKATQRQIISPSTCCNTHRPILSTGAVCICRPTRLAIVHRKPWRYEQDRPRLEAAMGRKGVRRERLAANNGGCPPRYSYAPGYMQRLLYRTRVPRPQVVSVFHSEWRPATCVDR